MSANSFEQCAQNGMFNHLVIDLCCNAHDSLFVNGLQSEFGRSIEATEHLIDRSSFSEDWDVFQDKIHADMLRCITWMS